MLDARPNRVLTFRQKIIFSQIALFLGFIILLFPFIDKAVDKIVRGSLEESSRVLIKELVKAKNESQMVDILRSQEMFLFFRITLINTSGKIIYDSHLSRYYGDEIETMDTALTPEVKEAFAQGVGYDTEVSQHPQKRLVFFAVAFDLKGQKYALRTAFPLSQVQELTQNFEVGFLILGAISLLFFSAITWVIFNYLSHPIQQIIDKIKPYQKGEEENLPTIALGPAIDERDDFNQLARVLNALTDRVKQQIESLTAERNEKGAILDSLLEGVIAVDHDMVIHYVNATGARFIGKTKKALIGEPFPMSTETASTTLLEQSILLLHECLEKNTTQVGSLSNLENRKIYIDLIAAPTSKGKGAILVLQDKTAQYRVFDMGRDFVANASHELRTPITVIRGFAETLQDLPELSQEVIREIIEKIVRSCQRMDNLVKSLLLLADLENLPESRFQEWDIISIIDNCRHNVTSVYPGAKIEVEKGQESIIIHADPDIFEIALTNLLDNAAKYSKPPARIRVKVQQQDQTVIVQISDQGIGIPEADLEHIFERFYTVNKAHSRKLGGAGLGLSIVKTIIEKHRGKISVASTFGQGTTFTILLPAAK